MKIRFDLEDIAYDILNGLFICIIFSVIFAWLFGFINPSIVYLCLLSALACGLFRGKAWPGLAVSALISLIFPLGRYAAYYRILYMLISIAAGVYVIKIGRPSYDGLRDTMYIRMWSILAVVIIGLAAGLAGFIDNDVSVWIVLYFIIYLVLMQDMYHKEHSPTKGMSTISAVICLLLVLLVSYRPFMRWAISAAVSAFVFIDDVLSVVLAYLLMPLAFVIAPIINMMSGILSTAMRYMGWIGPSSGKAPDIPEELEQYHGIVLSPMIINLFKLGIILLAVYLIYRFAGNHRQGRHVRGKYKKEYIYSPSEGLKNIIKRIFPKKRPSRLPPSGTVRRLYFQFLIYLKSAGIPLKPSMTAGDILSEVSGRWPDAADDLAVFTECYQKSRYGNKAMSEDELKHAETLLGRIKNKIISPDIEGDVRHARDN